MQLGIIVTACLLFATNGAGFEFSYDLQTEWPGVCVNGGRQSPINIVTGDVSVNSELTDLQLGAGWKAPINGTYRNTGHTVQFDPTNVSNPAVITTNYIGQYRVVQMHMHWGANNVEGSEHTVNSGSYPLELHFVHAKVGEVNMNNRDDLSVIGVFAQGVDMPISGVWEQLNISAIQAPSSRIDVFNLNYSSLLPSSLDYYHYPGSLTTPSCSEIVQWFVLKEPIQVPNAYLAALRQIESEHNGTALVLNFRDVQPLGQRTVQTPGSGSPKIVASALSILVVMFVTMYFS